MSIKQLPRETIHLLSSAQTLTTPVSLIKELVDNSIDAKATSINIFISTNTLDKIEVRDNGHGIHLEDLDALGRRGHTSKIRSFEELKSLGEITLGFRGEALASAVQLGEVLLTTRTDGEPCGTSVKLKPLGGIHHQTRTSHPIGTTVCVTKFMAKIPVRKQTALKEAPRTLAKIRELLQGYALARPSIKLSLKVAKVDMSSWSFAPRPNGGIKEAVSQVIGKDAAAQCLEKSLVFPARQSAKGTAVFGKEVAASSNLENNAVQRLSRDGCLLVEAYLPKPNAESSKIGSGQYLSIDSRPVSCEKGTMKKIVTMFKKYIRDAFPEASEKLKSPFLRLSISCTPGSYDANVEPAKDDVIFWNESIVLDSFESLLKDVYGACNSMRAGHSPPANKPNGFELLLARKPPKVVKTTLSKPLGVNMPSLSPIAPLSQHMANESAAIEGSLTGTTDQSSNNQRNWKFDMSQDFTETVEASQISLHPSKWSMLAIVQSSGGKEPCNLTSSPNTPVQERNHGDPATTFKNFDGVTASAPLFPLTPQQETEIFVSEHLDGCVANNEPLSGCNYLELSVSCDRPHQHRTVNDFVSARNIAEASIISPPATQLLRAPQRSRGQNRRFLSLPKASESSVMQDNLIQTKLSAAYQPFRANNDSPHSVPQQEPSLDIAWAMAFEQKKEDATRRRREELRALRGDGDTSHPADKVQYSPHQSRHNAATASLEEISLNNAAVQGKEPLKTSLPGDDPRAYLMRRQRSMSIRTGSSKGPLKPKRAKTMMLPLETIPNNAQIHGMVQTIAIDVDSFRNTVSTQASDDTYVRCGNQTFGFAMSSSETRQVERRLERSVKMWMESHAGKSCEVEYKFGSLVNTRCRGSPSLQI